MVNSELRILVEIMHGLGDTVCALPMVSELRRMYPSAYITVLCKTVGGRQIVEDSCIPVDEIIQLDIYQSIPNTLRTLHYIRQQHFDIGISSAVTPVRKSRLFMKACGVRYHSGLQGKGYNVFDTDDHFVTSHIKSAHMVADRYTPEISVSVCGPRLHVSAELQDSISRRYGFPAHPSPRIALCIGNADPSFTNRWLRRGQVYPKAWGIHNMKSLLALLLEGGFTVVLIGGPQETPLLEALGDVLFSPQVINLVGTCSVRESMAAISLCDVSVGIDTGMQHMAAALGVPTVSIFGPTNPNRCGAYGEHSHFVEYPMDCKYCYDTAAFIRCEHRNCLQSITPDQVYYTIQSVVNNPT